MATRLHSTHRVEFVRSRRKWNPPTLGKRLSSTQDANDPLSGRKVMDRLSLVLRTRCRNRVASTERRDAFRGKLSDRRSGDLTLERRLVYRTAGGPPRVAQCQRQSSTDLGLRRPIGAMGSGRPPCRTVAPLSPGLNTPAPTHPSVAPTRPPGTRVTGRSRSPDHRHADGPPSRSRGPCARGRKPRRRRSRAQPAPCP